MSSPSHASTGALTAKRNSGCSGPSINIRPTAKLAGSRGSDSSLVTLAAVPARNRLVFKSNTAAPNTANSGRALASAGTNPAAPPSIVAASTEKVEVWPWMSFPILRVMSTVQSR